jgi:hypothetical protein
MLGQNILKNSFSFGTNERSFMTRGGGGGGGVRGRGWRLREESESIQLSIQLCILNSGRAHLDPHNTAEVGFGTNDSDGPSATTNIKTQERRSWWGRSRLRGGRVCRRRQWSLKSSFEFRHHLIVKNLSHRSVDLEEGSKREGGREGGEGMRLTSNQRLTDLKKSLWRDFELAVVHLLHDVILSEGQSNDQ